jgi:hypothetical protein
MEAQFHISDPLRVGGGAEDFALVVFSGVIQLAIKLKPRDEKYPMLGSPLPFTIGLLFVPHSSCPISFSADRKTHGCPCESRSCRRV